MKVVLIDPLNKEIVLNVKDGIEYLRIPYPKANAGFAKIIDCQTDGIIRQNFKTITYKNTHRLTTVKDMGPCFVFERDN